MSLLDTEKSINEAVAKDSGKKAEKKNSGIAIGQRIKEVLADEGRTVTWLANQMGCSREYLYKVFSRTWISTDLLVTISEAMRHDFFKDFSRTLRFKKNNGKTNMNNRNAV